MPEPVKRYFRSSLEKAIDNVEEANHALEEAIIQLQAHIHNARFETEDIVRHRDHLDTLNDIQKRIETVGKYIEDEA